MPRRLATYQDLLALGEDVRAEIVAGDVLVAPAPLPRAAGHRARGMSLSFDDFSSNVVAFLDPAHARLYAEPEAWDAMQATVVARLEALS